MINFALKKRWYIANILLMIGTETRSHHGHMANGFPRATQSKKLHEIQDLLQELPPKDLNEMAATWRST